MGILASPWDDLSLALKGYVIFGTVGCANWQTICLHRIRVIIYAPTDDSIDTSIMPNPYSCILRPYMAKDAEVEVLHLQNSIYLPNPYVEIFLGGYIIPVEAWTHLQGVIVDSGTEVDFQMLIYWLQVDRIRKSGGYHPSTLLVYGPSAPLMYGGLLSHSHQVLIRNISVLDPMMARAQGYLINTHTGKVTGDFSLYQEEKAHL